MKLHRALALSVVVLAPSQVACIGAVDPSGSDVPYDLDDQDWLEQNSAALAASSYTFAAQVAGDRCLDVNGGFSADGTKFQSWECNGSGAQQFRVEDLGGGLSRVVHVPTSKCMDVAGAGTADGTQIQLHACNDTQAQIFRFIDLSAGNVQILNPHSNKCVDVNGRSTANGAKVLFGPAARSLPQLAISVDDEGYFVAQGDYSEPVGPSFWERKPHYADKVR